MDLFKMNRKKIHFKCIFFMHLRTVATNIEDVKKNYVIFEFKYIYIFILIYNLYI